MQLAGRPSADKMSLDTVRWLYFLLIPIYSWKNYLNLRCCHVCREKDRSVVKLCFLQLARRFLSFHCPADRKQVFSFYVSWEFWIQRPILILCRRHINWEKPCRNLLQYLQMSKDWKTTIVTLSGSTRLPPPERNKGRSNIWPDVLRTYMFIISTVINTFSYTQLHPIFTSLHNLIQLECYVCPPQCT